MPQGHEKETVNCESVNGKSHQPSLPSFIPPSSPPRTSVPLVADGPHAHRGRSDRLLRTDEMLVAYERPPSNLPNQRNQGTPLIMRMRPECYRIIINTRERGLERIIFIVPYVSTTTGVSYSWNRAFTWSDTSITTYASDRGAYH